MNSKIRWLLITLLITLLVAASACAALWALASWLRHRPVGDTPQDYCRNTICYEERVPTVDRTRFFVMKINGVYLATPNDLFRGGRDGAVFPIPGLAHEPNQPPAEAELFLQQDEGQPFIYQRDFLNKAKANDWIASRSEIRPGLELWIMKHLTYRDYLIDEVQYYVLKPNPTFGPYPPSSICLKGSNGGGGGGAIYPWKYGIQVYIRWPKGYCDRWPEIYAEAKRRLDSLEKID